MKQLLNSSIAIAITLLFCGYFFVIQYTMKFSSGSFPMDWSYISPEEDTAFAGIFHTPYINDSLPHYVYKKIEDSIKRKKDDRENINRSMFASGISIGMIGASTFTDENFGSVTKEVDKDVIIASMYDSVNKISKELYLLADSLEINKSKKLLGEVMWRLNLKTNAVSGSLREALSKKYYLSLKGYKTKSETIFFIQNGTYNLAYMVWDSVVKRTYDSTMHGHYERKQISVRYAKEEEKILIPITKKQHTVLITIITFMMWGGLSLALFFMLGLTLQILVSISKSKAFSEVNTYRLQLMAAFIFIYAFIATLAPYLFHFIFKSKIPDDFQLISFFSAAYKNLSYFFAAAIVFIVSIAFKKGYKLQQEQNLTV